MSKNSIACVLLGTFSQGAIELEIVVLLSISSSFATRSGGNA